MFGRTLEGGNGVLIGASGASCNGTNTFLIQNNTFTAQGLRLGCSGGRAIVRSNILPGDLCSGIERNGTYSYNVFPVGTTDSACLLSSHAKVCNPLYSDPNRAVTGDYSTKRVRYVRQGRRRPGELPRDRHLRHGEASRDGT